MPLFSCRQQLKITKLPVGENLGPKKIPTRKCFRLMKYTRQKVLDPQNTYEKKFETHEIPTRKNL